MFKKNKAIETLPQVVNTPTPPAEKESSGVKKSDTTVIASDVRFEGNIVSNGHVYIYGSLKGNIDSKESLIKVMRGGLVDGNITCQELIIDGSVNGQCTSESIEIYENGYVTGTLAYKTLAIKKGGMFSGQAEVLAQTAAKGNVVGLVVESAQEKNRAAAEPQVIA